ncbi:Bifunctional solanapyrone synthase [Cytospora mali]|uniref:Bifunctional solanapyrone synthase n=1 Tax=Cytospora mali TaxID=578113 RepID=A0A194URD4_CYTMA|nr:Bifunctional solanapyrone synthase [Valsa mali var. pyri (nom. inval.)]
MDPPNEDRSKEAYLESDGIVCNVEDVSIAVKTLVSLQEEGHSCLFAIRSGGHSSWAGASSILDGTVIDLSSLNTIELSTDKSTVSVGVGATWGDVYKALDPQALSVNGGRAYGVGVGGLMLGSGLSHTSPRYGWICDTVSNFQVVLADGSVTNLGPTIIVLAIVELLVTSVTLAAFQQDLVWSGTLYHLPSYAEDVIKEFVKVNSTGSYDEYASVMTTFAYVQARGMPMISNLLAYTKEVEGTRATFEGFLAMPSVYKATSVTNMTNLSIETEALNRGGVSTSRELLQGINTAAKDLDGFDPYIFMNYADKDQDVIGSYGAVIVNKLRQVRQVIDPKGTFTYHVPGGYKVPDS